jgi:hypothetical protein
LGCMPLCDKPGNAGTLSLANSMEKPTSTERRIVAQIAAHESWARTGNRSARTLPARMALKEKFAREADPDNKLAPAERAKAAESLRKAHYARMALKSAQARRRRGASAFDGQP